MVLSTKRAREALWRQQLNRGSNVRANGPGHSCVAEHCSVGGALSGIAPRAETFKKHPNIPLAGASLNAVARRAGAGDAHHSAGSMANSRIGARNRTVDGIDASRLSFNCLIHETASRVVTHRRLRREAGADDSTAIGGVALVTEMCGFLRMDRRLGRSDPL